MARPSEKELSEVKHHFIATHSLHDEINASVFENYALQKANEIFSSRDIVIMAGGTGLYIKAFCEGLDAVPAISREIRERIIKEYEEKGIEWLQQEINKKDPEFYKKGEIKNPQRMMRALEVVEMTGRSILEFRKGEPTKREFAIIKIGLELPKEELHRNIDGRVDKMLRDGLVHEVQELISFKHLPPLQTVGYSEIFSYFEGKNSLEEAIDQIRKNTRQYAKRQMTWFRKDREVHWFHPAGIEKIKEHLQDALSQQPV